MVTTTKLFLGKQGPGRNEKRPVKKNEYPVAVLEKEVSYMYHNFLQKFQNTNYKNQKKKSKTKEKL
jgi:hypothetical protein